MLPIYVPTPITMEFLLTLLGPPSAYHRVDVSQVLENDEVELHGLMRDFCRRTVTDIVNANFDSGKKDKIVEKALQFFPSLGAVDQQVRRPSFHSFSVVGPRRRGPNFSFSHMGQRGRGGQATRAPYE